MTGMSLLCFWNDVFETGGSIIIFMSKLGVNTCSVLILNGDGLIGKRNRRYIPNLRF
jgi:hypothetical protein